MTQSVVQRIESVGSAFDEAVGGAADAYAFEQVRIRFLGRKGEVTQLMRGLGALAPEERREAGRQANELRGRVQSTLASALDALASDATDGRRPDLSLPGRRPWRGGLHPIREVERELVAIFRRMGFDVALGPEVELDYYNFRALNFPDDHPARDMHDTFYLDDEVLLRTHTSPVQVRTMEKCDPPVRVVTPGRVYRSETVDASHLAVFHQIEGLYVDTHVTMADLKGTLAAFARALFGARAKVRFRPDFFPFTEPSVEFAFSCLMCQGDGCALCKRTGWLEIGGAGMVDPEVFGFVGYDPEETTGYAFGLGIERIAALHYGFGDIRPLFENDLRLLEQTW